MSTTGGRITEHDHVTGYCRMLGHHLSFAYCRNGVDGTPCKKILDCWFERFDVLDFATRHHPEVLTNDHAQPPPAKLCTLVDLIRQARQRNG